MIVLSILLFSFYSLMAYGELVVHSRPEILVGNASVVEGSVAWLYCDVNSTANNISAFWRKNMAVLAEDVPHIRMRNETSSHFASFLLVIDNIQRSDSGNYQCVIQEREKIVYGENFNISVFSSAEAGDITIFIHDSTLNVSQPPDNRTFVQIHSSIVLFFLLGHTVGSNPSVHGNISTVWLKDGSPTRVTPNVAIIDTDKIITFLNIVVQESDAGDYQCIFYDDRFLVYYLITPIRLDTANTVTLQAISPSLIILQPLEKLVIKVRGRGPYENLQWIKNGSSLISSQPPSLTQFGETLFIEPVTVSDLGLYKVQAESKQLNFIVSHFVPAAAIIETPLIALPEGSSRNITCSVSGIPTPSVVWEFDNELIPFRRTVQIVDVATTSDGYVVPGKAVSTLYLENIVYPQHQQTYSCIGMNMFGNKRSITKVSSVLNVQVVPDVTVSVNSSTVLQGDTIFLECNVLRGSPSSFVYTWRNSVGVLSVGTNSTHTITSVGASDIDTYTCEVENAVGDIGRDNVTIRFGVAPNVTAQLNSTSLKSIASVGSTQTLTCHLLAGDAPVNYSWTTPNNTTIQPSSTDRQIRVIFSNSSFYGNYTCVARNRFGFSISTIKIVDPGRLFQLQFLNVRDCNEWRNDNRLIRLHDISSRIVQELRRRCKCEIHPDLVIKNSGLKCFKDSPNTITYRAQLNGVLGATSSQLLEYIKEYVRSSPSLLVDGLLIQVDGTCTVSIESNNDPRCTPGSIIDSKAVIIGVITAILVMMTAFLLCCMCVLRTINMRRRWHLLTQKMFKSKYSHHKELPIPSNVVKVCRFCKDRDNASNLEAIYYEVNSMPSTRPECKDKFIISKCPAYNEHDEEETLEFMTETNSTNNVFKRNGEDGRRVEPLYYCSAYVQTSGIYTSLNSSKEDLSVYQCPSYKSDITEDGNSVDFDHYVDVSIHLKELDKKISRQH